MRLHYLAIGQKNKKILLLSYKGLSDFDSSIFPDFSHQTRRFVQSMEGQLNYCPEKLSHSSWLWNEGFENLFFKEFEFA